MALLPTELLGVPVVLDQHGPHYLEREYQKAGTADENTQYKLVALRKADFFTCAGTKQLAYFQAWLEQAGWTEQERREQAAAIPVSLSPDLPDRQPDAELTFVYGGVFLPWQDPSIALSALVQALDERGQGRQMLCLKAGRFPPSPDRMDFDRHPPDRGERQGRAQELPAALSLRPINSQHRASRLEQPGSLQ